MDPSLHVVEPTLEDARGHCRSLLAAFCGAAGGRSVTVWAGQRAPRDVLQAPGVSVRPWFRRRVRRLQAFRLLRRLLRRGERVWISTAGRTEIVLAHRALGRHGDPARLTLYVHWLEPTPSRMRSLAAVARRRPGLRLLAATPSVAESLSRAGFAEVRHVPYPLSRAAPAPVEPVAFRRLLYAGAARRDKGFHRVADLVARMHRAGMDLPVAVQTGGDYYGRMAREVRDDLARLEAVGYPALEPLEGGMDPRAYGRLFPGAVCLQLYDPAAFADRVSGVTLDALAAGAPVVALAGSWIARQVERFDAGAVLDPTAPEAWPDAVADLVARYDQVALAARSGGDTLAREHDPARLVEAVFG